MATPYDRCFVDPTVSAYRAAGKAVIVVLEGGTVEHAGVGVEDVIDDVMWTYDYVHWTLPCVDFSEPIEYESDRARCIRIAMFSSVAQEIATMRGSAPEVGIPLGLYNEGTILKTLETVPPSPVAQYYEIRSCEYEVYDQLVLYWDAVTSLVRRLAHQDDETGYRWTLTHEMVEAAVKDVKDNLENPSGNVLFDRIRSVEESSVARSDINIESEA